MFLTKRSDERCFIHSLCVYTVRRYLRDPSPYRSVMGAEGSTGGPICSANELEERKEEGTVCDDRDDTIDVVGAMTTKLKMAIDALQIIIMIKIS